MTQLCFLSKLSVSVKKMSSRLQCFISRKESHLLSFYFEKFNLHTSTRSKILFFLETHISTVLTKLLLKSGYFSLRIPILTSCSSFKRSSNNFSISLILMEVTYFFLYRFLSIGIRYRYQLIIGLSIDYAWCNASSETQGQLVGTIPLPLGLRGWCNVLVSGHG